LTASIKATLRAVRLLTMVIFQGRSGHGKAKELTNLLSWLIHRQEKPLQLAWRTTLSMVDGHTAIHKIGVAIIWTDTAL